MMPNATEMSSVDERGDAVRAHERVVDDGAVTGIRGRGHDQLAISTV